MAKHIPFPTHLTEKDIALNDALPTLEAARQPPTDSVRTPICGQDVLAQQLLKQLLTLATGAGCPTDPNTELDYFPEDGFIPQERYL